MRAKRLKFEILTKMEDSTEGRGCQEYITDVAYVKQDFTCNRTDVIRFDEISTLSCAVEVNMHYVKMVLEGRSTFQGFTWNTTTEKRLEKFQNFFLTLEQKWMAYKCRNTNHELLDVAYECRDTNQELLDVCKKLLHKLEEVDFVPGVGSEFEAAQERQSNVMKP